MTEMKKAFSPRKEKLVTSDFWFSAPMTFFGVLLVFLFACFVNVMWSGIDWQSVKTPLEFIKALFHPDKKQILTFLGLSMGGILLAMQSVIANRRAKAMDKAAGEQARANENTEKGQRQERLKNAIEHLGNTSDSVRLGGAYELFHLAKDTEEWSQTILDILCAHIRQTTSEEEYKRKHWSKPSEEIQSLLTLLFVQEHEIFKGLEINLQGSWLRGARLFGARLQGAYLREAQLQGAVLSDAELQEALLFGAKLQGTRLYGAQLQNANLSSIKLQGANLFRAQLQGADLSNAQLQGANLSKAQLQGTSLLDAQLQGAVLSMAQLQWAALIEAQLQGAQLGKTQLQGADLFGANLRGVTCQNSYVGSFKERIENRVGQNSDVSGVIFAGGLAQGNLDSLVEGLPDDSAMTLREILTPHVNQEVSHVLPGGSEAIIAPPYTQEEAEQWIADYEKAISEVPQEDNS